jgi:TonB family protein
MIVVVIYWQTHALLGWLFRAPASRCNDGRRNMIRGAALVKFPIPLFALFVCASVHAQTSSPPSIDPDFSQIAARIADPLQKSHVTKVIFADLKGPNGETHPAGRWLADQLANACQENFPDLAVIIRPADEAAALAADGSDFRSNPPRSLEDWARRMGASVFVSGTFAKLPEGIGITLTATTAAERPQQIAQLSGLLPMTEAISSLSAQPLPVFRGGIPRAGLAGNTVPTCVYCPSPKYAKEAKAAKYEGSVVLQATISEDGRAINISIVKDPGKGLGEKAVEAVRRWKFRPAVGPDGRPTAVICPIEVRFHLY